MNKLNLITGGYRSGKSSFAISLSEFLVPGEKKLVIGTNPSITPYQKERIQYCQQLRKESEWKRALATS